MPKTRRNYGSASRNWILDLTPGQVAGAVRRKELYTTFQRINDTMSTVTLATESPRRFLELKWFVPTANYGAEEFSLAIERGEVDPLSADVRLGPGAWDKTEREAATREVARQLGIDIPMSYHYFNNPRPPAASDFIRNAINNVKAKSGNFLYLVRPAGSFIAGQTRSKTDVAGAEEIAAFLKSLRWTEVTEETRKKGAGFGKVRYFQAKVPAGVNAYEAILLWGELTPEEKEQVSIAKAFHQSRDPNAPTRYELVSTLAPKKARLLHIAIGHMKDPFTEPKKRTATVYTWYPGRITPMVESDLSKFPRGVDPRATVKAAEVQSNPARRHNPFFDFLFSKPEPKPEPKRVTFADMAPRAGTRAPNPLDRWRLELFGPDGVQYWSTHSAGGVRLNAGVLSPPSHLGGLRLDENEARYIEKKIDEKSWADGPDEAVPTGSMAAQTHEFVLEGGPFRGWTLRCVPIQRDTVAWDWLQSRPVLREIVPGTQYRDWTVVEVHPGRILVMDKNDVTHVIWSKPSKEGLREGIARIEIEQRRAASRR
jgi:hypothetical protein